MNDTFSTRRPRLSGALAVLLTAAAVAAVLVLSHGVPDAWWPKTGNAFPSSSAAQSAPSPEYAAAPGAKPTATAASTPTDEDDPCDLIVGPAHDYCAKGRSSDIASGFNPSAALLLAPAVIGIVVVRFLTRRKA